MPGTVTHAKWTVGWQVPWADGQGLVIDKARFDAGSGAQLVLFRASQPFVLVPYHGNSPTFKDGLGATCGGVGYTPLVPTAPNAPSWNLPPGNLAANDDQWDPTTNPLGNVVVEKAGADLIEPERLVLWGKYQVGNYQYVHRWEFGADGSIHVQAGLGGRLWTTTANAMGHIHNFYYRLDFDVNGSANNLVQRFAHANNNLGSDGWTSITMEARQTVAPAQFTTWRVVNKTPKPNGALPGWEIVPGSDGAPDGIYSTGDTWVVRYQSGGEVGEDVGCNDTKLTSYANNENTDGQDVVVWHVLRHHHNPRPNGEETDVVPYEFLEFHIEARDVFDATPRQLYTTTPPSPL